MKNENAKVKVSKDGPYLVSGNLPMEKQIVVCDGDVPTDWQAGEKYPEAETRALCRCGLSKNKPFCDGSHVAAKFDGTETAKFEKYDEIAEIIEGPGIDLADAGKLCSSAGFCHGSGGTWQLTAASNDEENKKLAVKQACNCPSGRLCARHKSGEAIEPEFEKSIGIIEEPTRKLSGPIWLRGGVEVESADGEVYETRNRVTLCRCGKSNNKPFCDGTHVDAGFNDEK